MHVSLPEHSRSSKNIKTGRPAMFVLRLRATSAGAIALASPSRAALESFKRVKKCSAELLVNPIV
jgi:hypothetical protein